MKLPSQHNRVPAALKRGDTIGIVAPAGPFEQDLFDQGIEVIHEMGFLTKVDEGIFERTGFLAGSDDHRAAQFNTMVADDEVQAVMCARGGYGTLRILDRLDYSHFEGHPKAFIGFSDITAIHQAILSMGGSITFHGPMVTTLARSDKATRTSWRDAIMGAWDFSALLSESRTLNHGVGEGVLTGGNLATLCHLVGTPHSVDYSGTILLIEEVGEAPYRIDRMLTQMRLAGVLDGLSGLIVGALEQCGPADEIHDIISGQFADMDIPILTGAPVGHGRRNLTVPLGARVRLDSQGPKISLIDQVDQNGG